MEHVVIIGTIGRSGIELQQVARSQRVEERSNWAEVGNECQHGVATVGISHEAVEIVYIYPGISLSQSTIPPLAG